MFEVRTQKIGRSVLKHLHVMCIQLGPCLVTVDCFRHSFHSVIHSVYS